MPSSSTFVDSLLYIRDGYESARWNFPAAVGTSKDNPGGLGTAATVQYSFLSGVPSYYSTSGFRAFTGTEQQAARDALQSWSAVARITFQETSGVAAMTFGMDAQSGSSGYAYSPSYGYSYNGAGIIQSVTVSDVGGDVWLDSTTSWTASDFTPGGFGLQTLVHEIGHAIGLKHSFESDNGGAVLTGSLDHKGWTTMSYTEHPHGLFRTVTDNGSSWSISYDYVQPETPMIGDIAAVQVLYGANTAWHSGNDSYGFDPSRPFLKTIWDGGGTDTISVSNFSQGCVINLNAGTFSTIRILSDALPPGAVETHGDIYDGTDNLGIAYNVTIENATGGSGADTLLGNGVANVLTGNGGNDNLQGNAGNDTLNGGSSADTMSGGTGNDTYLVDNAGDTIVEAAGGGADLVKSSIGWTLGAEVENLTLTGTSGINATGNGLANTLTGNAANNVLNGSSAADKMSGGAGNDTYIVDNTGDTVTEAASGGTDLVKSSIGWTLGAEIENLTLTGTGGINATGNGLANTLTGNGANNVLSGGTGADRMSGGTGNDTYVVDNAGDTTVEAASGGTDLVKSSISWTLGAEIENLTLTGSSAVNATGNGLANTLTGNGGTNQLDGGAGADKMSGGSGNDTYLVDNVGDVVTEAASGGIDLVKSSIAYTLGAELENLRLTGSGNVSGKGNGLDNVLVGNAGSNALTGGGGFDIFAMENLTGVDTITDFVTNTDDLRIRQSAIKVGDGDVTIDGAVKVTGPGGFARTAELVIISANISGSITTSSAAAKIGSATSAYAVGATALFAVDNGVSSAVYLFKALDSDAIVESGELTLLATLSATPYTSLGDFLFG